MSAFNDYCIVCDQLCSTNSVYCSDSCKFRDSSRASSIRNAEGVTSQDESRQTIDGVTDIHNQDGSAITALAQEAPQSYISPLLQASTTTTTTSMTPLLYHSPLLISHAKENFDLDSDTLNLSEDHHLHHKLTRSSIASSTNALTDYLSTTSINYKKWLHATKATISN